MKKMINILLNATARVGGAMLAIWGLGTLTTGCYRMGKKDAYKELENKEE